MLVVRELGRFGVVGVINVITYYTLYLGLHLLVPYLMAHVLAYVASMSTSFLLNCHFTYRTKPTVRKFLLFPVTQVIGLITSSVGVTVLVAWVGLSEWIGPIVAAAVAVPVSFILSRRIITGHVLRPIVENDRSRREPVPSGMDLG